MRRPPRAAAAAWAWALALLCLCSTSRPGSAFVVPLPLPSPPSVASRLGVMAAGRRQQQHQAPPLSRAVRSDDNSSSRSSSSSPNPPWWKTAGVRLRQAGSAGLLAYGVLNAAYYSLAVALLWWHTGGGTRGPAASVATATAATATATAATGVKATAQRFAKVLALAWAGSQVTKPLRAGGAVLLAPAMGRVMDSVQRRLGLKRRGDTVPVIVAALLLVTGAVFGSLILQGTLSDALHYAASAASTTKSVAAFVVVPPSSQPSAAALMTLPLLASSTSAAKATATQAQANAKPPAPAPAAAATEVELNRHGQPKRRPKKQYLPPNPHVHGWDQHPPYLRGKWNVTSLVFADGAGEEGGEGGAWRGVVEGGLKALVLKRGALALLRGGVGNLTARGWEFTPANRRLVVEVALPPAHAAHAAHADAGGGGSGDVLRFSGEVRRKPKHWCRATGSVRLRPAGSGKFQPHRALPSSDPSWPIVGRFVLERDMALPPPPSRLERLLVWLRLEAPRFSDTKAGRRAKAYLGLDEDDDDEEEEENEEGGGGGRRKEREEEWNARALKFEMWKYFE
jgi:hypothetical protein